MFGLGTTEMIIILVILLLLFGAKRIPKLASALGESVRAFKAGGAEPETRTIEPTRRLDRRE